MLGRRIAIASVREAFQKSRLLLDHDLKIQGAQAGWHQFIGEQKIGIVGSALGILCLKYTGQKSPHHAAIVRSLIEKQNRDQTSADDGGWCLLSSDGLATVEATAWALLGLADEYSAECESAKQAGLAWLRHQQNIDGGWGGRKGLASRTYATLLACRAISVIDPVAISEQCEVVRRAKEWVLRNQHPDSGWGARPQDPSSAIHTAFAVLAALALGLPGDSDCVQRSIRFILSQWEASSNWENTERLEQYEIPKSKDWTRITFQFFPTPWCVVALMSAGCDFLTPEVLRAITSLLKNQEQDGSWVIPGIRPTRLWIIHDALFALATFLERAISRDAPLELLFAPNMAVVYERQKRSYLARALAVLLTMLAALILGLGVMIGKAWSGNPPTLKAWAWFTFGSLMTGSVILAKYKLISWRDVLLVMLIPGALLVLQIYMGR